VVVDMIEVQEGKQGKKRGGNKKKRRE